MPAQDLKRGQSIAALVLGRCSVIFYFTVIVPLLAIVFAGIAMSAQRKAGKKVNGMATAGLALGIAFLPIGLLFVLFMASAWVVFDTTTFDTISDSANDAHG